MSETLPSYRVCMDQYEGFSEPVRDALAFIHTGRPVLSSQLMARFAAAFVIPHFWINLEPLSTLEPNAKQLAKVLFLYCVDNRLTPEESQALVAAVTPHVRLSVPIRLPA